MNINNSPTCRGCGLEPETARHFVCSCPTLMHLRARYLGDYYLTPEEQLKIEMPDLLSFIMESKWLIEPERDG